jgi:hypothetical protein
VTDRKDIWIEVLMTDSPARPGWWRIAGEAVLTGVSAALLIWLVATHPENPRWWDWLGVLYWVLSTGIGLFALVVMIRRRWATASPTGYVDRDGDRWYVRPDGMLVLNGRDGAPAVGLEGIRQYYGPLEPFHD